MAESFIVHTAPVRVGVVFSSPPTTVSGLESATVALINAFNYVAEEKDRFTGLSFITEVNILRYFPKLNFFSTKSRSEFFSFRSTLL